MRRKSYPTEHINGNNTKFYINNKMQKKPSNRLSLFGNDIHKS